MHGRSEPLLVLIPPLLMKKTRVTDKGQELHQVSLSPMIMSTITNVGTKAHLEKVWEMTL